MNEYQCSQGDSKIPQVRVKTLRDDSRLDRTLSAVNREEANKSERETSKTEMTL